MIQAKEYVGWVYCDGYGDQDGYFRSIEELVLHFKDHEIALPQFVKACTEKKLSLDADWIIENALDGHHEDAGDDISVAEREELQAFLDKWCERTKVVSYEQTDVEIILWTLTDGVIEDLTK